jgi:hypothetical protein
VTEADWDRCGDPLQMLLFLGRCGKLYPRKVRLWACACVRRAWHLLPDSTCRAAVEVTERYAEHQGEWTRAAWEPAFLAGVAARDSWSTLLEGGTAGIEAIKAAWAAALVAPGHEETAVDLGGGDIAVVGQRAVEIGRVDDATAAAAKALAYASPRPSPAAYEAVYAAERAVQCHLLRDSIRPFAAGPVSLDAALVQTRDGLVRRLARALYDEQRFEEMPVLADALEEAGCRDELLLSHCRGPGPHARGCFVLDALLGME